MGPLLARSAPSRHHGRPHWTTRSPTIQTPAATIVLFNPGSRSGARVSERLRAVAVELGNPPIEWVAFADLPERREVPQRLIAIGGDGTVNYAASWLRARGATCELAIVPAGTGNNLARGLGIPLSPEAAFRAALLASAVRPIDAISVQGEKHGDERLMLQSGALGFPAHVAQRYDSLRQNRLLRLAFVPTGPYIYRILSGCSLLSHAWRKPRGQGTEQSRAQPTRVTVDGVTHEEDCFALFIGNERSLGGNFIPCPRAKMDDGLIDLCLIRALPVSRYPKLFQRVARGTHVELQDEVLYLQGKEVWIDLPTSSPLLLDGDLPMTAHRYTLRALPGALTIVGESSRAEDRDDQQQATEA